MYHAATFQTRAYYDRIEEMPTTAKVFFPKEENRESVELTIKEIYALSEQGYYFIEHTCNYGSCDHWIAQPLSKWVDKYFLPIISYTDKQGVIVGYNRKESSVSLTKNSKYWKSEVWNS